jgi:uncharacterized protein YukE
MPPDLEVDTDALRRCASELTDTSAEVADGVAQSAPLGPPRFGWATADALAELERAADRRLDALAASISATSRQVEEVADGYEAADDRAAARLRATR